MKQYTIKEKRKTALMARKKKKGSFAYFWSRPKVGHSEAFEKREISKLYE